MKIVVDGRAFFWTGVGRYVRNLLREYAAAGRQVTVLAAAEQAGQVRSSLLEWGVGWEVVPVEGSYYSWREQVIFWRQLQRLEADLVHFAHFNVPVLYKRPYVVTIHDVTRFYWPGQVVSDWRQQVAYEFVLARAVAKARAVVCVSDATKQELLGLPFAIPAPVRVIGEGVEQVFLEDVASSLRQRWRQELGWKGSYFLYVGVWMNHKNLRRLLLAFRNVAAEYEDVRLVLTGEYKEGYVPVPEMVSELGLKDKVILPGFVSAQVLPAAIAEATALTFPSLYEGFGLPLLEAAGLGCPVLTSNVSSMPEVMEAAGYYVNPDSVKTIALGMRKLLENEQLRVDLAQKGRERARHFDWQDVAAEMWEVYERALG